MSISIGMVLVSSALVAAVPGTAHAAPPAIALVAGEATPPATTEAAPAGKVWFAIKPPDNMKAPLADKKIPLIIVGFLPFGAVWGPMMLLGQSFDSEWALAPLVHSAVAFAGVLVCLLFAELILTDVFAVLFCCGGGWVATQTMFANLNRTDIEVTEKK